MDGGVASFIFLEVDVGECLERVVVVRRVWPGVGG